MAKLFLMHEGSYREWVAPQTSGTKDAPITFQGLDRDKVVLTGADIITDWKRAEGDKPIYRHTPWTARFPVGTRDGKPVYHHPADEKHKIIGRSEQVIVDGKLLEQVLALGDMKPGTFSVDLDASAIYVWLADDSDPGQHRVEASTRGWVFGGNPWSRKGIADYIHLRNVTIRHAANHAQRGALFALANPTGISVREQGPRSFHGRYREETYHVRSFVCQNNLCAFNTKYQFGLWSDNIFFGPHPSAGVSNKGTPLDPAQDAYRNLRLLSSPKMAPSN